MAKLWWLYAAAALARDTTYEEKLARDPNKRDPETKVDIAVIMHGLSSPTRHTRYDGCTTTNADWRPTAHQIMTYLDRTSTRTCSCIRGPATRANK